LFCGLAFAAWGSSDASVWLWCVSLITLCLGAALLPRGEAPSPFAPLALAVFGYAAWLLVTNLWLHSYTPLASYEAAFLVLGFLVGRKTGRDGWAVLFAVALAVGVALAVWSIGQRALGVEPRGRALFETPATLAAMLNLLLAPGLVLVALGRRSPWLLGAMVLLAAALIGTASRGGWLALGAAAIAAVLFLRRAEVKIARRDLIGVGAILVAGSLISQIAPLGWDTAFGTAAASGNARLDLYRSALGALSESSLLVGSGYLDFRYVLEAARPSMPEYHAAITYFAHNDYLQVLLELGIPGFLLLLVLAVLPATQCWRDMPRLDPVRRTTAIALAVAMTSMAVHALVDFPFYIPACLLMYGAAVGGVSSLVGVTARLPAERHTAVRIMKAAVAAGVFWILLKPVAAEAAAEYARQKWRAGDGQTAAHWFEVARRVESKDWRFHWYAGQFWFVQAQAGSSALAAQFADRAFAAGIAANPRVVENLLWRISTHIYLRTLLPDAVDKATLRQWADRAQALAPLDPGVKVQRDLVARFEAKP
jgi:O-antigen ligase